MTAAGSESSTSWRFALIAVMALHLASTSGAWWITDHGEILGAAHNVLEGRGLTPAGLDPSWERNWRAAGTPHSPTRFLPLSVLSLTPFLLVDQALGLRDPGELRFAHLQGHFFTGIALLLAGRFVAAASGSPVAAALCVLVAGLNWPVWMIARRLGPEPVLLLMVTALVTLGPRARFACLVLLPWVHASGPLLALGAVAFFAVEEGSMTSRPVRNAALGAFTGALSVALLWNLPVHGHLLLGGYESYRDDPFFRPRNPVLGVLTLVGPVAGFTLPLAYLAGRDGRLTVSRVLALAAPSVGFFGVFSSDEPERRLAPLIVAIAAIVTARMSRLRPGAAMGLALFSLGSGVFGLSRDFVTFIETPLGRFSGPHLLILRLAFEGGRPFLAGSAAILLAVTAFVGAAGTVRLLLAPELAVGSNRAPRPESNP